MKYITKLCKWLYLPNKTSELKDIFAAIGYGFIAAEIILLTERIF